ncbi:MAG TPA: Stk1 family PASTA domain-containing Ser/Thr kinase, partial [Asanoa sp.]|nr:Stk1 family PASTA domain-containing Ser/Thr kinase [Asanoa sp.]
MTQARLLGGRYQVGELLGYGGMAEVHRGRDLRLGRDVAIKMLRTDLARDATFQMRFRREAQNAASLNHPAIVAVYDTGEEIAPTGETLPFIVMEFVNGRTLKELLAAEGRLMPRRALEISADICAALEFSHRHGIIHRDIKPGNVMLTQNGQVKVMDFGIARALASGATTMTQTSAVIGTAQYLSPEQARGEAVDARSDVYAAGCVLFELVCGHPPFVGDSPVSVAYQHVREDPRAPSEINHDVTPPFDAIVLKALSKNPLNRYQSAGEMRADLLRAASGRPVMATPVMRDQETMPMGAANAATGTVRRAQGAQTRAIPAARVGDAQRRKRSNWVLAVLSALGVLAVIALVAGLLVQNARGEKVDLTSVIGQPLAAAQATLTGQGLVVEPVSQTAANCEKDTVTNQDPAAGSRV